MRLKFVLSGHALLSQAVRVSCLMAVLSAALQPVAAAGDAPPSVLVRTQPARFGEIPETLTTYGSAVFDAGSVMTLSVQRDGRVERIAVAPGEAVTAGQVLITFGASAQSANSFRQAQSALVLARQQQLHAGQLLAQHLVTRDQKAQADKAVSDAANNLQALRTEGADTVSQNLKAPFDGVVQAIPVRRGDRLQPGAALVVLAGSEGVMVTVGLEPALLGRVHPGQPARLQAIGGEPGAAQPAVAGHVRRVAGQIDPRTRLVNVDLAVDPAQPVLPGEAFRAELEVGRVQGWQVPHEAVMFDGADTVLYQIAGGRARRIVVQVRATGNGQDIVTGPLDAARAVVVAGAYQLHDGMAVRMQEASADLSVAAGMSDRMPPAGQASTGMASGAMASAGR